MLAPVHAAFQRDQAGSLSGLPQGLFCASVTNLWVGRIGRGGKASFKWIGSEDVQALEIRLESKGPHASDRKNRR